MGHRIGIQDDGSLLPGREKVSSPPLNVGPHKSSGVGRNSLWVMVVAKFTFHLVISYIVAGLRMLRCVVLRMKNSELHATTQTAQQSTILEKHAVIYKILQGSSNLENFNQSYWSREVQTLHRMQNRRLERISGWKWAPWLTVSQLGNVRMQLHVL